MQSRRLIMFAVVNCVSRPVSATGHDEYVPKIITIVRARGRLSPYRPRRTAGQMQNQGSASAEDIGQRFESPRVMNFHSISHSVTAANLNAAHAWLDLAVIVLPVLAS